MSSVSRLLDKALYTAMCVFCAGGSGGSCAELLGVRKAVLADVIVVCVWKLVENLCVLVMELLGVRID